MRGAGLGGTLGKEPLLEPLPGPCPAAGSGLAGGSRPTAVDGSTISQGAGGRRRGRAAPPATERGWGGPGGAGTGRDSCLGAGLAWNAGAGCAPRLLWQVAAAEPQSRPQPRGARQPPALPARPPGPERAAAKGQRAQVRAAPPAPGGRRRERGRLLRPRRETPGRAPLSPSPAEPGGAAAPSRRPQCGACRRTRGGRGGDAAQRRGSGPSCGLRTTEAAASPVAAPEAPGAAGDGGGALRALGSSRALWGRREAAWRAAAPCCPRRLARDSGCASGTEGFWQRSRLLQRSPERWAGLGIGQQAAARLALSAVAPGP